MASLALLGRAIRFARPLLSPTSVVVCGATPVMRNTRTSARVGTQSRDLARLKLAVAARGAVDALRCEPTCVVSRTAVALHFQITVRPSRRASKRH